MPSQRHRREVHEYDSSGQTPYDAGDWGSPNGNFIDDLAGQTYNFKLLYPTGTSFSLSGTPTGMTLNGTTGVLSGTPTTVQSAKVTLTVTYTSNVGARTKTVPWSYRVYVPDFTNPAAGAFTQNAVSSFDFTTAFPTGTAFALTDKPVGMTLNAGTGALTGTPTAVETGTADLTVTYTATVGGARTVTVPWSFEVTA